MRLQSIKVSGFQGIDQIALDLSTTITLVCGPNGASKSSMLDAVRLAMIGDLGRVSLKKDAGQLVRQGHQLGATIAVVDSDGDAYDATISKAGAVKLSVKMPDPILSYVLDAQRLAGLDPKARRQFLSGLAGVKATPEDIKARLLNKGCDGTHVDRILPLLRSGFDAAHEDAAQRASDARASWKIVAGEAYGSEKAKTWRAPVPTVDAEALARAQTEGKHAEAALAQWNQQIGALSAEQTRRAGLQAKLAGLHQTAALRERVAAKLAVNEATLADVRAKQQAARAAAGSGPRAGLVHDLALSLHIMLTALSTIDDEGLFEHADDAQRARAGLEQYEAAHGKIGATSGDPAAAARLPDLIKAEATAASALDHDRRDLAACDAAQAQAAAIQGELAQPFDADALAAARQQAETLTSIRAAAQATVDTIATQKRLADGAEAATVRAATYAQDVAAWERIADALGPNGIPSELLAASLKPINDRLAQSRADAGWPLVRITGDIEITVGGRAYRLASESERWRADAMLAEAVSHLSGAGVLLLDGADVLEPALRPSLIDWLDVLASNREIGTAIVCMTLKQAPQELPETVQAVWIEGGRVIVQQSAKAAQKEAVAA